MSPSDLNFPDSSILVDPRYHLAQYDRRRPVHARDIFSDIFIVDRSRMFPYDFSTVQIRPEIPLLPSPEGCGEFESRKGGPGRTGPEFCC